MRKLFLLIITLLVIIPTLGMAAAFTNGSFESPAGNTVVFLNNGDNYITGWIHGGNNGGEFYSKTGDWGIAAGAGTYYLGWGASGAINGTLSQTFDTAIGTTYNVNYLLSTQQLAPPIPIESNKVEALDGSTVLNTVTNDFNQNAGIWLSGNTLSFVATSTSTTLRFTDLTTSGNSVPVNWTLDDVTVDAVGAGPVGAPEPTTYLLA